MKFKKLLILILILTALTAAVFFKKNRMAKLEDLNTITSQSEALFTDTSSKEFVSQIGIQRGSDEKILLVKDPDGRWSVQSQFGAKTRRDAVDSFHKRVWEIKGEKRAENKEVLTDFSLTDEAAIHIRLMGKDEKELGHVLLSPLRPRGTLNFVRRADSDAVMSTDEDLLASLGIFSDDGKLNYRQFAELRPAGIDSSKVKSFVLTPTGGKPLSFDWKEAAEGAPSGWTLKEDPASEIDTVKVNEFFSSVHDLYANDAIDPTVRAKDYAGQTAWLELKMKEGQVPGEVEIWIGSKLEEENMQAIKTMPDGINYKITASQLEPLLKKNKDSFLKAKGA